jgi:putative FmdB family regulatory protein
VPTYQYVCTECGGQIEAVQKFTDDPLTVHDCGGKLRKVFSPVGIVFKGSGFYRTDSRSGAGSTLSTTSSASSASSDSGSSAAASSSAGSETSKESGTSAGGDKSSPGSSGSAAKANEKVA